MTEMEQGFHAHQQRCQDAVALFISRHPTLLLTPTVFVERTVEHMRQRQANDPYKAATGIYSLALYDACSGNEGAVRQEYGYQELYTYLHTVAVWRYSDVCDDATQSALVHIYEQYDQCRQPIAFLAFALGCLMNAARSLRRQDQRQGDPFDEDFQHNPPLDPNQADPLDLSITDEQRVDLQHHIDVFRRTHTRATNQLDTLILKHLHGMDDQAISKELGVSVKSVHELRARICKRLRGDTQWRALAIGFGLLSEEE